MLLTSCLLELGAGPYQICVVEGCLLVHETCVTAVLHVLRWDGRLQAQD